MDKHLWLLVIIYGCLGLVTSGDDREIKSLIDRSVETVMKCYNIPGLSLTVLSEAKPWYTQGYGVMDVTSATPVTEKTRFCVASITKSMSATLLAILLHEHKNVTWDTPLKDILGSNFRLMDQWRTEKATLRDVLAHKMGTILGSSDMGWLMDPFTRDQLTEHLQHFPIHAGFRTKFMYNNYVYGLAAVVAEALEGQSWERLMMEKLFKPLDVKDVTFLMDEDMDDHSNITKPHCLANGKLLEIPLEVHGGIGPIGSAASVCITGEDMARYLSLHLNQGRNLQGTTVVQADLLNDLHSPEMALPSDNEEMNGLTRKPFFPVTETRETYGMGWVIGSYRGLKTLMHGGILYGFDSLLTLFPEAETGVYVAINGPMGDTAQIAVLVLNQYISDLMLGLPPWLNQSTLCSYPFPWKKREEYIPKTFHIPIDKTLKSHRSLKVYKGKYVSKALGTLKINEKTENGNSFLFLKFGKRGQFNLYPTRKKDRFRAEAVGNISFLSKMDFSAPSVWLNVDFIPNQNNRSIIDKISLNFLETDAPVVFKRQLPPSMVTSLLKNHLIM